MQSQVQLSAGVPSTNRQAQQPLQLDVGPDTHSFSVFGQDTVQLSGLGNRDMHCTRHATSESDSPRLGSFATFGVDRVTLSNLGRQAIRCNVGQ